MADGPEVDGRRRDDLRDHVESVAPYYTDEWDPATDDAGSALVALFAEMAADVTERLDRAPEKHRAAFFDALGFDRRPPLSATLPVTFTIAEGADENIAVEPGTEVIAGATDDRPEATFRIGPDDGFEATPARLREIYSVEPEADQLFDHRETIGGEGEATLFAGEDRQRNVLYVGHPDLLDVSDRSAITVHLETQAPPEVVRNGLVWEYYGERTVDGEAVEDWHELTGPATWADHWPSEDLIEPVGSVLDPTGSFAGEERSVALAKRLFKGATAESSPASAGSGSTSKPANLAEVVESAGVGDVAEFREELSGITVPFPETELPPPSPGGTTDEKSDVTVELAPDGPFVDTEVNGVESKWIRCRVPDDRTPTGPFDVEFDGVSIGVEPASPEAGESSPEPPSFAPDLLLANDVPQKTGEGQDGEGQDGEAEDDEGQDESITPFGKMPQQRDAFYVASQEAFTKKGATVTLSFDGAPDSGEGSGDGSDPQDAIGEIGAAAELSERELSSFGNFGTSTDGGPNVTTTSGVGGGSSGGASSEGGDNGGGDETDSPRLSWEYWNGDGWLGLDDLADGTNRLQTDGAVTFTVPDDFEASTVAGHDGVWIRTRLIDGDYGDAVYVREGTDGERWERTVSGTVPQYDAVTISYDYPEGRDPAHLFAYNNREFGPDLLDREHPFHPFEALPDVDQTVYFGFDGPLHDGPIQLFVDLTDHEYPEGFNPRVKWEYCADPERDDWLPLDGSDASEGFTEQGIASLAFPEETTAFGRFGHERHWIRARLRGDAFGTPLSIDGDSRVAALEGWDPPEDVLDRLADHDFPDVRRLADLDAPDLQQLVETLSTGSRDENGACGEVVETDPPAGKPTNERPTVLGVYPNAGMAANVIVVENEVVGSSDGSPGQAFVVSRPPVVAGEVWVDELTALSAGEREDLQAERPDAVDVRTGPGGEIRAFWVRWESVAAFFESGADDRHYTLDPVAGEITFGDGTAGRIPPHGRDNMRVTYRTGGGPEGNVAPGAVGDVKSALPLVDAVTNPAPGAGGARAESTEAVLERAPRALRDRGRAVTAADFERIAMDASRQLARVRCIPEMDRSGEHAPGWVTLLVVPNDQRRKPTPSVGLKRQVRRGVSERAPARLVARDRIEVRGPSYVSVGAEATIVAGDVGSLGALEDRIEDLVSAFLHPLTGGEDGDGWAFGDLPALSDVFALLEGTDGVDYVAELQLQFEGSQNVVSVTEGEPTPSVAPDALVHSGVHDFTVRFDDRTRRGEGS